MSDNELPMEFGNYILLDLIARGGMAEIYRAKMRTGIDGFEKLVAIKKILPNLAENEEFITMLIDEARISVSLNHANIAQVYDLGRVDDSYYIAMEYVPGIDLSHVIKKLGKEGYLLPLDHAIYITKELCAGLYFAHRKTDENGNLLGIVHRDISPHNVLVAFSGDVKVIDFGVAKASVKLGQTRMGVIKGKLLYMAPEQAMARPIDARADLFSAGLCLYRMLTGHLPFEADNEFQIYNNVLTKPITPPQELNPEIPEDLNAVVMKSLARDVNDRYADGWLMHQDLEQVLQRVSPGYTGQRLSRFLEEYFADEKPRPTAMASSAPRRVDPAASSYPSAPAAQPQSYPSGHVPQGPNTPPNMQPPVPVAEPVASGGHVVGQGFAAGGPTVPLSSDNLAAMLANGPPPGFGGTPANAPPSLPSPEELGFKPSNPHILEDIDDDSDADPTVDMQLDPAALQRMGDAMMAQPQARQGPRVVAGPSTPQPPPVEEPLPDVGGNSKVGLIIALVVGLLFVLIAIVAGFFLLGGPEMLGFGDSSPSPKNTPPAAASKASKAEKDAEKAKKEAKAPPKVVDPGPALKEANEEIDRALKKVSAEYRALVDIRITSEPAGAEVFRGRTSLGETPVLVPVARSERPVKFKLKMSGYKSSVTELVPSADRSTVVVLEESKGKSDKKPARKGGDKKDTGKKGGDKKGSDLLDPW